MLEDNREQLDQLNQQVDTLYQLGHYTHAIQLGIHARDLALRLLGADDLTYATSLNNLGTVYDAVGNYEQAADLYVMALAIRRTILGEVHPVVAQSQHNLAALSEAVGDYTQAEQLYQQALTIRRATLGNTHPDIATTLNNLAELYRLQGKYPQAEAFHKEALQMRQALLPEGHPEIGTSLNNLALLYGTTGKYPQAETLYKQALAIWQTSLGNMHPHTGACFNNLAALYELTGDYVQAEKFYQEALEIRKAALGEEHSDVADTLNNLAGLYRLTGRYQRAEPLYQQSLILRRRLYGERHPDVAESLNNLGVMYQVMGHMPQALNHYRQAMSIWRAVLGDEHPQVGMCFNNIGALYMDIGDYTRAEHFYLRALAIRLTALGQIHVDSADTLNNLAELYFYRQDYRQAALFYKHAWEIRREVLGEVHADVAASLNNLALVHEAMGNDEQAEDFYLQASTIWNKAVGGQHPDIATHQYNLAVFYLARGRIMEAWTLIKQATEIDDLFIGQIFSISSENQRMAYLSMLQNHYNVLLSFVYQYHSLIPSLIPWGFDVIQHRKTIRAEVLAVQRDVLLGGHYPTLVPKLQELNRLHTQIAQKVLAGPGPEGLEAYRQFLEEQTAQKDRLEAELARQIPEMNLMSQLQQVDRQSLCQILPAGSALVEFAQFYQFAFQTFSGPHTLQDQTAHYVAFVLLSGEPDTVQLIDIGSAGGINQMIATFRASLIGTGRHLSTGMPEEEIGRDNGSVLRAAVFDPLLPVLHESKRLFLAPDGDLYSLSFEILPTDDGNHLIDSYQISYLDAGRDLLRLKSWSAPQSEKPLVLAAPEFDLSSIEQISSQRVSQAEEQLRQLLDERTFSFAPLPGAEKEGKEVAAYLGVTPYLGREAVESRLKSWRSPGVLHIATHGFFLKNAAERKISPSSVSRSRLEWLLTQNIENPLLRSGLALAGANTWSRRGALPEEAEDGILTAEDVSGLDLLATSLVVLSACETGLGEVQIGEGVFGLRRAFMLAGTRTLIMSLWKVPDRQTQELMERFYRAIVAGIPCGEALQRAKQDMKNLYENPFYWGAFICQGDPYTTYLPASDNHSITGGT